MKFLEYKNLLEALYIGHEFSFKYKNKSYFLERSNNGYTLYDITDLFEHNVTGKKICEIDNSITVSLVNEFLDKKIFDGLSFNEIYNDVEIIDIE